MDIVTIVMDNKTALSKIFIRNLFSEQISYLYKANNTFNEQSSCESIMVYRHF